MPQPPITPSQPQLACAQGLEPGALWLELGSQNSAEEAGGSPTSSLASRGIFHLGLWTGTHAGLQDPWATQVPASPGLELSLCVGGNLETSQAVCCESETELAFQGRGWGPIRPGVPTVRSDLDPPLFPGPLSLGIINVASKPLA